MKDPKRDSRFPFFLTLPLTDPISPFVLPAVEVLAARGPTVSVLLLLPLKLNRFPSVAREFGCGRVGDGIGDLDRVGETNDMGPFLVRSGEVTGDVADKDAGF